MEIGRLEVAGGDDRARGFVVGRVTGCSVRVVVEGRNWVSTEMEMRLEGADGDVCDEKRNKLPLQGW